MSNPASKIYISKGRVLDSPPLSVRIRNFFYHIYIFFGLYFVSLFALNAYAAAEQSRFNTRRFRQAGHSNRGSGIDRGPYGGGGGGEGGRWGTGSGRRLGGGGGPSYGPGRRIGRVDDIRAPECGNGGCGM